MKKSDLLEPLEFIDHTTSQNKTKVVHVRSLIDQSLLGVIKWFKPFDGYSFISSSTRQIAMNQHACDQISQEITKLMKEHHDGDEG